MGIRPLRIKKSDIYIKIYISDIYINIYISDISLIL